MSENPRKFHFLGICGTAMGSLAAALRQRGFKVTGSDENIYPPMSSFLEKSGIPFKQGYRAENIPADADMVVRTAKQPQRRCWPGSWKRPDANLVISSADFRRISDKVLD